MFRTLATAMTLTALSGVVGCGSGSESTPEATTVLSVPDPDTPAPADLAIGGAFEGSASTPPVYNGSSSRPSVVYRDANTNSMADAEIARAPGFTIVEFGASYEKVKTQNPSLDTSSNEFAQKIIDDLVATVATIDETGIAGKTPGARRDKGLLDRLTADEKALILRNPLKRRITHETPRSKRRVSLNNCSVVAPFSSTAGMLSATATGTG